MSPVTLFSQTTTGGEADGGSVLVFFLFILAVAAVAVAGVWKTFQKAGHPGWAAIVPVYNTYILLKIADKPAWWLLMYFIPFVNIIISILVCVDVAKAFGKSDVFGVVGLWLFSVVGYWILGFGDAQYQGSAAQ